MERTFLQGGRLKRSTAKIDSKETIKRLSEIAKNGQTHARPLKITEDTVTDLTQFGLSEIAKNGQTHARPLKITEDTVTDLTQFGLNELDYIDFLDFQLYENLREIEEDLILINRDSEIRLVLNKVERIMTDTLAHRDKIRISKEKILNNMEEAVNRRTTPCDYPDNEGHYSCPYDAQGGDDCRNFCGLGVDE